jgi:hypothetical protein
MQPITRRRNLNKRPRGKSKNLRSGRRKNAIDDHVIQIHTRHTIAKNETAPRVFHILEPAPRSRIR